MKTNKVYLILLISAIFLFTKQLNTEAQVTIGSNLPPERGALLDIKEKKADIDAGNLETTRSGGLLMPRIYLSDSKSLAPIIDSSFITSNTAQYERMKKSHTGLIVYNLTESTAKGLSVGLFKWDGTLWNKMVDTKLLAETVNELKTSTLPYPAVFMLNSNMTNFLNGVILGGTQSISMVQVANTIPNYIQLSADGRRLTIAPGLYLIQFTYEATHNANCGISSYFVDFPDDNYPSRGLRIHSNSSHDTYAYSNHGGTISAPCLLTKTVNWDIAMGRGQSGDCTGSGMTLYARSTFVYIVRYNN